MKITDITDDSDHDNDNILLELVERDTHLYNASNYATLYKLALEGQTGNHGIIKAFVYGNSLRFKLIFENAPEHTEIQALAKMINQTCEANKKNRIMLWYSLKYMATCNVMSYLSYCLLQGSLIIFQNTPCHAMQ